MFSFHLSFIRFSFDQVGGVHHLPGGPSGRARLPKLCQGGTGTVLPRRQSQQVHLGGYNHLGTGNLLSPWWRPGLASQFQDLQRLLEKEFNKLPVEVLAGLSIAGC